MPPPFDPLPGCALFDLDGTLLDTAPDMAAALNRLRLEEGRGALPLNAIRPQVSHGARAMIRVGFGLEPGDAQFEELRERFLAIYASDLACHTLPFPGIPALLDGLAQAGIPWGIVTNKPGWLTDPLLETLGLHRQAGVVVSGDSLPQRKPQPEPLLYACAQLAAEPLNCVYVGDAGRDIEAGRRAGMRTLAAAFGYIPADDDPAAWGADGVLHRPEELMAWLLPEAHVS
jgi:phosphoglycolate phosphatase